MQEQAKFSITTIITNSKNYEINGNPVHEAPANADPNYDNRDLKKIVHMYPNSPYHLLSKANF